MSQALVNELNKMQEVLGQNMNVLKQSQATLSGNENAANFDRIFDKQLRKEDPTIDKIKTTSENVSNEVVEDVKGAINEVEKAVKDADSSIKLDKYTKENSDIKEKVDGLDSAQAKKDVKSELSLIEQLAEIRDLLEQVTSEANVENSLDLTLTKNIEDFISQLKDYCRPITDNNIGQNIWGLEIESDSKTEINQDVLNEILEKISALLDSDSKQELKLELPNLFEQVLTYIDNKDVSLKQDTKVVETLLESKEAILENSSEMIRQDETVDIFTENDTLELQVNTELQKTGEQELILDEEMLKELSIESVSSETYASSGDGESLLQGQTPQEQGVRVMIDQQLESFELKIDKAMNAHMSAQQHQGRIL